ncbi:MAG: hypothetical protein ABSG62_22440 [Terracidiphilus sp.]
MTHHPRAVDFPNDIPFDGQTVESARHFVPDGPKKNTSVFFALIGSVDIVDIEIRDKQMMCGAKVRDGNQDAPPKPRLRSLVRDFKLIFYTKVSEVIDSQRVAVLKMA